MSDEPKFKYIGESRDKVVLEMKVDGIFVSYVSMRKADYKEFPNLIPDPWKENDRKHGGKEVTM